MTLSQQIEIVENTVPRLHGELKAALENRDESASRLRRRLAKVETEIQHLTAAIAKSGGSEALLPGLRGGEENDGSWNMD